MSVSILRRPYINSEEERRCLAQLYLPNSDADTDEALWLQNFSTGLREDLVEVDATLDDHIRSRLS